MEKGDNAAKELREYEYTISAKMKEDFIWHLAKALHSTNLPIDLNEKM